MYNIFINYERRKDMPWKPAKMVRFLLKHGFVEEPKSGGHRSFIILKQIPMHAKELRKGTENQILKEAGLSKRD
ncbi:hypothetical protein LBJG_00312 [Lactobacillus jensenii 1153]|nr:hypothetical protein LBJG_00312 [Lactobacillus jensenii 1153]